MAFIELTNQLRSLTDILTKINEEEYNQKIKQLSLYSIGAHTRHMIEIIKCLIDAYDKGIVYYSNRKRNIEIETVKAMAIEEINWLINNLMTNDKPIIFIDSINETEKTINSSFYRELIYCVEHTTHHLALIKVGLLEMKLDIAPKYFGVAKSTIQHQTKPE